VARATDAGAVVPTFSDCATIGDAGRSGRRNVVEVRLVLRIRGKLRVQQVVFRVGVEAPAVERIVIATRQPVVGPVDDGSQGWRSFAGAAPATSPAAIKGPLVKIDARVRVGVKREIRR